MNADGDLSRKDFPRRVFSGFSAKCFCRDEREDSFWS
jgi:hypothetical protein